MSNSAEKLGSPHRSINVMLMSVFSLKQKVLSFLSKSWAVEKEVLKCFKIKITNTNRI